MRKPESAADLLNQFVTNTSERVDSKVLNANQVVLDLIDKYLEAYVSGKTRRTMLEFHKYLKEECSITFSYDTLKRYCKKYKTGLWTRYTEVRNGKKVEEL